MLEKIKRPARYFYLAILGLFLYELTNTYLLNPFPGSQEMESIAYSYFFYAWRWAFRIIFVLCMFLGGITVLQKRRKWIAILVTLLIGSAVYLLNFKMTADHMFYQVDEVVMIGQSENEVPPDHLVIGVVNNGEAKAYPIEMLTYHHQVQDVVGGKAVIVTYCVVCRTGRVFEPTVLGKEDQFRLVGMNQYNAMLEDGQTGTWWQQATGEAIAGELKGERLPEVYSIQTSVKKWFEAYPDGMIMQPDPKFAHIYDTLAQFEKGNISGGLVGTDTGSWNAKSWIIGVEIGSFSKAYDWNGLVAEGVINDQVGEVPLVVAISSDEKTFAVFERNTSQTFTISNDILSDGTNSYDLFGESLSGAPALKSITAYQEFWHSWRTFHPLSEKY